MLDLGRWSGSDDAGSRLWLLMRGSLFQKYVLLVGAAMAAALALSNLTQLWFTARDHRAALIRIEEEQAKSAAGRISQFMDDIEGQLGWMTQLSWSASTTEQREIDALRLLRQVPAITELTLLDENGRERLWVSRQAMDRVDSRADRSGEEAFRHALAQKRFYGPVVFRRGSEPTMMLAVAGARRDAGVAVAEVNLTLIWDVIHTIKVGREGRAYVVGPEGRLIAHPDISLVLRNTDMFKLEHVRAARAGQGDPATTVQNAINIQGERVLTAYAIAEPLGWTVFVELPEREADEPLRSALLRSVLVALAGLGLSVIAALVLARHMVVPIQNLSDGAARIGAGSLDHRISIRTGDELQALGERFNTMADKLQKSYATLERKVDERTKALQEANQAKSRFLAVASHDLRQPLHALNLLAAQLSTARSAAEQRLVATRVDAAIANMNELFNALLDISKLDAGAMVPTVTSIPLSDILARVESTFGAAAVEKGLHLAVVRSSLVIRTDPILLERILNNLVSNAVRYTKRGGVVVGCRRRSDYVRIDVCDTGIGIPEDQRRSVFAEFHRGTGKSLHGDGLGLGLSIVDRLCTLLAHPIELASSPDRGTRFSITVPLGSHHEVMRASRPHALRPVDPLRNRHVVILDDDPLVLDATGDLLRSWGCEVSQGETADTALGEAVRSRPDLVISDYHLQRTTGIEEVAKIRAQFGEHVPALIVSGDIAPEVKARIEGAGLALLHKPLSPMALRAAATRLLMAVAAAPSPVP